MTTVHARTEVDREQLCRQLRVDILRMTDRAQSGHPTSSLSAVELFVALVTNHLRLDLDRPDDQRNDRFVLSKGHATPLLYAGLRALGLLEDHELDTYRRAGSRLEGHPTPAVPLVPAATGSLGQGLPIGVGLALGADLLGIDRRTFVLCGDGELAEGSTWEAAEHAGHQRLDDLVVLVDVNRLGQRGPTRHEWDLAAWSRRFEAFAWSTFEVDGHDVAAVDEAIAAALDVPGPAAVLARTVKGKGVPKVEDEDGHHGKPVAGTAQVTAELGGTGELRIPPPHPPAHPLADDSDDDAGDGERDGDDAGGAGPSPEPATLPRWDVGDSLATRDAWGAAMRALGGARPDLVLLDGEVANSTRGQQFADAWPDRFVEAHIAEQLMFGIAIGLAASGLRPVVSSFGAFLTRAFDFARMIPVSGLDVLLVGSHAGVAIGEDGPSQMALEDLAWSRAIAGSTVLQPSDANQTAALTELALDLPGVTYLRTMRGDSPVIHPPDVAVRVGGSAVVRTSVDADAVVVTTGVTVHEAIAAVDEFGVRAIVVDAYSIQPLDARSITSLASATGAVVVAEDHRRAGGLGEGVATALVEAGVRVRFDHLAVDGVPGSATSAGQLRRAGVDREAIAAAVEAVAW